MTSNAPVHLEDTIVSTAGKAKIAIVDGTIILEHQWHMREVSLASGHDGGAR
jgi:hypothetical protein